jgi:hypothetical protein
VGNNVTDSLKLERISSHVRPSLSVQKPVYTSHSSQQQIDTHEQITPRYKSPFNNQFGRKLNLRKESDLITITKVW